ncbi:MAG: ATP-grasp domain-containing protein [Acidobacteriota bacterium]
MDSRPHILILFRNFSSVYRQNLVTLTRVAQSCGFRCAAIVGPDDRPPAEAVLARVEACANWEDERAIRALARRLARELRIELVFALFEDDVFTAGLIREDLRVPGPTSAVAIHFRNKTVMHTRAAELGIPTPRSCLPLTWKMVSDFIADVGLPVVLKPSGGHGAMHTHRVDRQDDLQRLWHGIENQRELYRLEQYIAGDQFHLDCVVRGGGIVYQVLSRYTANLLNYSSEPGGTVTRQGARTASEDRIVRVNQQVIEGFGLEVGITHGEYFLTGQGEVFLGEIGARPPGGSILPTIAAATGVDLVHTWALAEMAPIFVPPQPRAGEASTRFLASRAHGRIVAQTTQESLLGMEGIVCASLWRSVGDVIGDPQLSSDFLGYVIACAPNSSEAVERVQRAANAFDVVTEPLELVNL